MEWPPVTIERPHPRVKVKVKDRRLVADRACGLWARLSVVGGWVVCMQMTATLEELTEGQLLDHADEVARLRRECEVQELRIAVQHAVINNPETLDPDLARLPGREKAKRYGGLGTPRVAEFCCATLAGRLGISAWAGAALIADGLDITIRLPKLWARVQAFEVKVSYARHVARKTRDLTPEQAAYVDTRVAESADGRIAWSRFEELVAGAVAAADPDAAAERERTEAERQYANPTRSTEHGMRGFYIRGPFHVIALLDARVTYLADILATLGDTDPVDHRRVKAIALLANPHLATELIATFEAWADRPADPGETAQDTESPEPGPRVSAAPERAGPEPTIDWAKVFPSVTISVHTYTPACDCDEPATGITRADDAGPVTDQWVRHWLGDHARFTIRPVLDIEGQAPVDDYQIPERHRRAVSLMTPADTFPFASSTRSRSYQVDHSEPFDHAVDEHGGATKKGQSRIGNYGPMTRFHHRIKTHGGWDVTQPWPGLFLWRDPHGAFYLVDHTGTRRVTPAPEHVRPNRAEIYLATTILDIAA
jgi:hypothetical protein